MALTVKKILDDIFIAKKVSLLKLMAIAIIILYGLKSFFRFSLGYTLKYVTQKVVEEIRNKLYKKIIYMPVRFFSDNSTGSLISIITNDVNMMQQSIPILVATIRDSISIFFLVAVIFYLDYKMAIMAIIIYPIFIHPLLVLSKRIRKYSKKGQEEMAIMTSALQESFSGVRVVKSFVQEVSEIKKFSKSNKEFITFFLKAILATEIASPLMEFVGSIGIAGIVYYGGYQVIKEEITTGDFFGFLTAVTMAYEPVKRLGNSNAIIQQALASSERVFGLFSLDNDILDNDGEKICDATNKPVILKNVSFKYETGSLVLDNLNLTIPAGLSCAFVGYSGAGKSTIANLIPRFYDVTEGGVYIGENNIKEFKVHSLRENIGYVFQEPFLFNDTIYNNIVYINKAVSEQEVINAAKSAYAHDFIMSLPDKYQTVIGERGVRLSGGQKQRITIARAILKNAPILILDEATSSLDSESEREVQKALDNLMIGKTSFIIAHRLTTIINSDLIVVLDGGKISMTGKHEELLYKSDLYRKLYLMHEEGKELSTKTQ